MGQFSQSTCWTLAEDLRPQKDEKYSHIAGKDERKKKGKGRERKQDRTCVPGRELKMRRRSCICGSTFTDEEISSERRGDMEAKR